MEPSYERYRLAEEERIQAQRAKQAAEAMPMIETYGRLYVERDNLAGSSRER